MDPHAEAVTRLTRPPTWRCPGCGGPLSFASGDRGHLLQCGGCDAVFLARPETPPPPGCRERPRYYEFLVGVESQPRRNDLPPHRGPFLATLGVAALVCLPLVVPAVVLGATAWWLAGTDLREMDAGRLDDGGADATACGRHCGLAALVAGGVLAFGVAFLVWFA